MTNKKNIKIISEKNEKSSEKKAGPFNLKIFIFLQITLIVIIFVALKFFVRVEIDGINGISFSQIRKDGFGDSSKKIGEVLQQAGINNLKEGNFDEASNKFEEVLQKDGESEEILYQLALVKYNQKKYPEAIVNLEKVIQKNPKKAEAYNVLGNINRDLKKSDEAMKNYRQAIVIDGKFIAPYTNLAIMFLDINQKEEAKKIVADGLKNNPDNQELRNLENILNK